MRAGAAREPPVAGWGRFAASVGPCTPSGRDRPARGARYAGRPGAAAGARNVWARYGCRTILPRVWRCSSSRYASRTSSSAYVFAIGTSSRPVLDQLSELREHGGGARGRGSLHLDAVPLPRLPVDDRVDAIGRHSELVDGERDVARAERVDQRVDLAVGDLANASGDAVAVGDRDRAVLEQPLMVALAGEPDDGGAGEHGELHGQAPDPAGGARDDDGVTGGGADRAHGRVGGRAGDEQRPGRVPGDVRGLERQLIGGHEHELGVACALLGEPDHLRVDGDPVDAGTDLLDDAGKVGALARGERRGPALVEQALADRRLAWIEPGGPDPDQDLPAPRNRPLDVDDVQDVDIAVVIEPHRARHPRSSIRLPVRRAPRVGVGRLRLMSAVL